MHAPSNHFQVDRDEGHCFVARKPAVSVRTAPVAAGEPGAPPNGMTPRPVSADGLPREPDPVGVWIKLDLHTRRIVGRRME